MITPAVIIIPAKNPHLLAEKINETIENQDKLDKFAKNGLARVKKHFTIPEMVENLEKYFIEKLNEKKQHSN